VAEKLYTGNMGQPVIGQNMQFFAYHL